MPALSTLLRFRILDRQGAAAELADLVIRQLDTDYPPVTHLVLRTGQPAGVILPWEHVRRIDWPERHIHVERYEEQQEQDTLKQAVWLRRDTLDALVLDLQTAPRYACK